MGDMVIGNSGRDTLNGGDDEDLLRGGNGDDTLSDGDPVKMTQTVSLTSIRLAQCK
ncbi:hypothetical protein [Sagittula sp. SSi028]|uniref:hypothetical protein n=1 Tax=Sagittula sp. SSi028 TaxID=3400636 RepID=UPI003AF7043E